MSARSLPRGHGEHRELESASDAEASDHHCRIGRGSREKAAAGFSRRPRFDGPRPRGRGARCVLQQGRARAHSADAGLHDATVEAGDDDLDAGDTSCRDVPVFATVQCGDDVYIGNPYLACGRSVGGCYFYRDFSCPIFPIIPFSENHTPNPCGIALEDCLKVCTADGGELIPLDGGPIAKGEVWECLYVAGCEMVFMDGGGYGPAIVDAGPYTIACGVCPGVGRRPAGLRQRGSRRRPPASGGRRLENPARLVGRHFEAMAHLEAASVYAFERLSRELCAHGAPSALVRLARDSARDEVRHARLAGRLAERFGGRPRTASVGRLGVRFALRAHREGERGRGLRARDVRCSRCGLAGDACPRRARAPILRIIARDELRHAALAWAVATWADERLDGGSRARVARAQSRALERLGRQVEQEASSEVRDVAGLPTAREARALFGAWMQGLR